MAIILHVRTFLHQDISREELESEFISNVEEKPSSGSSFKFLEDTFDVNSPANPKFKDVAKSNGNSNGHLPSPKADAHKKLKNKIFIDERPPPFYEHARMARYIVHHSGIIHAIAVIATEYNPFF